MKMNTDQPIIRAIPINHCRTTPAKPGDEEWMIGFGSRVRAARKARHWKTCQLAHKALVSTGYIRQIERGCGCSYSTAQKIKQALGGDLCDIAITARARHNWAARKANGDRIRLKRESLGLSVKHVAYAAKIHPRYLYIIERGVKTPSPDVAARIEESLKAQPPDVAVPAPVPESTLPTFVGGVDMSGLNEMIRIAIETYDSIWAMSRCVVGQNHCPSP